MSLLKKPIGRKDWLISASRFQADCRLLLSSNIYIYSPFPPLPLPTLPPPPPLPVPNKPHGFCRDVKYHVYLLTYAILNHESMCKKDRQQSPGEIKRREVSWTLSKSWTIICRSRRDQEEGGELDPLEELDYHLQVQARSRGGRWSAGPSREPRKDQEQERGAGLRKLNNPLLQFFLTSCATDIVLVTLPRTVVETAISEVH